MTKGKNVLTTGDVAKICNVAPRTVSKWFDSGQLRGYRIPGSKDRRIPLNELIRFMQINNIPSTALSVGKIRILIVDSNVQSGSELAGKLCEQSDYEVQTAGSNFETGIAAQRFAPHVVLINLLSENINASGICKNIRADESFQAIKLIAIANKLSESEAAALLQKGFDGYVTNADDITEIITKIEEATAIIY